MTTTFTTPWMCAACGTPVPRPWLTDRSTFVGRGLASGLAMEKMVAEQDRGIFPKAAAVEIAEELYGKIPPLDKSVWEFTPGPQGGTLRVVAEPLMPENFFALATLPTDGGTAPPPLDHRTRSDRHGLYDRDDVPDSVAGCRLGCACPVHGPVKPAPWMPGMDEFDLLPDA